MTIKAPANLLSRGRSRDAKIVSKPRADIVARLQPFMHNISGVSFTMVADEETELHDLLPG